MKYSKKSDYLLVVIGCIVALYAQVDKNQNVYILVLGIAILMFGLFKISASLTSNKNKDEDTNI